MSWRICDPRQAARRDTKIVRCQVPFFPDGIDYEDVLGRAFSTPTDRDWMASGGMVILATAEAYARLRELADAAYLATPAGVASEIERFALERQCAALRWVND